MGHARMRTTVAVLALLLAAGAADALDAPTGTDFVPPAELAAGWYARIETSHGRIVARLHPDQAPQAVAHFAALARGELEWRTPSGQVKKAPYYEGIPVNFVRAGHLFEVGDPHGNSDGVPQVFVPWESNSIYGFGRAGRLGTSRRGIGRSGAVFFVTASANRDLERSHTCFGTVVSDLEVVYRISEVKAHPNGRPVEPVVIEGVHIFSVGDPPPLPTPVPHTPQRVPIGD